MLVLRCVHADGRDAKAEEAGVVAGKLRRDRREIEEVAVDDFAQLRVRAPNRLAIDHQNLLDGGIGEALKQHAFADHAGRARDDRLDAHAAGQ